MPSMFTLFLYKVDLGPHAQAMESSGKDLKPADGQAAEPVKSQTSPQPAEPAGQEDHGGSQHGAEKPNEPAGPPPVQAKVDPLTEAINASTVTTDASSRMSQSSWHMTSGYDEYGTWWEQDSHDDKLWWFKNEHESWRRWRDQSAPWLLVLFCCFVSLIDLAL